jgi:hypothetical protein
VLAARQRIEQRLRARVAWIVDDQADRILVEEYTFAVGTLVDDDVLDAAADESILTARTPQAHRDDDNAIGTLISSAT